MSHKSIEVHVDYAMLANDILEDRPNHITDLIARLVPGLEDTMPLDREAVENICEDRIMTIVQEQVKEAMGKACLMKRIERVERWMREGYRTVLHSDAPEA